MGLSHATRPSADTPSRQRALHGAPDGTARFEGLASRAVALTGPGDAAVAWVAERQHGVIGAQQAEACGLTAKAVAGRRRRGAWRRLHHGAFLLGSQEPSAHARILAAVLSCWPQAVASHATAAWLWGMIDRLDSTIHVLLLEARNAGRRPGVHIHRPRVLAPRRVRWRQGIPLTCPLETLLDLAGTMGFEDLEAACALAISKRLTTLEQIRTAAASSPPRPGIGHLRKLAASPEGPALTRSGNERRMLQLVRQAELPNPEPNVVVCGKELDLYWSDALLGVEVDAFGTHGSPLAFEADRHLDTDFKAAGIEVLRFTASRIRKHPHAVVARLSAVLALRLGGLPLKWRR